MVPTDSVYPLTAVRNSTEFRACDNRKSVLDRASILTLALVSLVPLQFTTRSGRCSPMLSSRGLFVVPLLALLLFPLLEASADDDIASRDSYRLAPSGELS